MQLQHSLFCNWLHCCCLDRLLSLFETQGVSFRCGTPVAHTYTHLKHHRQLLTSICIPAVSFAHAHLVHVAVLCKVRAVLLALGAFCGAVHCCPRGAHYVVVAAESMHGQQ